MGMLRRGEVWYFRKQIGGREYVVSTGFKDKKLAERAAGQIEQEIRSGKWGWRKKSPAFAAWGAEFLSDHVPSKSPRTVDIYTRAIERATKTFGQRRLSEISRDDLRGYLKKLSRGVQTTDGKVLRRALGVAQAEGKVEQNPLRGVRLPGHQPRTRVLSVDEEKALAADPDMGRFVVLGIGLGLRVSEMLSLTPESRRGQLVHVVGKGSKNRAIPILGDAAKAFEEEVAKVGPGQRLFSFTRGAANQRLYTLAATLKLPRFSTHDLRRTFGTRWAQRVKPAILQKLMGHSSIVTTMKYYVHLNDEEVLEAVTKAVTAAENSVNTA